MIRKSSIFPEKSYNFQKSHLNLKRQEVKESFNDELKSVFSNSVVPGVPQIISSKSRKKKIFKTMAFIFCLAGFFYQTQKFLVHYWTYPTLSYTVTTRPSNIVTPAITFCSNNRFQRKGFCEMFPFMCIDYNEGKNTTICSKFPAFCMMENNKTNFCEKFPRYCLTLFNGLKLYINYKVPSKAAFFDNWFYRQWKTALLLSPKILDPRHCQKKFQHVLDFKHDYCLIQKSPFVVKGYPTFCETLDSQLGDPDSEDTMYNHLNFARMRLDTDLTNYMKITDPILIYAVVHNRRHLLNPFRKGIKLTPGNSYRLHVSMKQIERLPFPYNTNCTDYLKLWRENNGSGPLDKHSCIEYCKLQKLKSEGKCIDEFVTYAPHLENLCEKNVETTTYEMNKRCVEECQPACLK